MVGSKPQKEPRSEAELRSSMAKAGTVTTGLAPSSSQNCISLSLSTLEKLKQHQGCRAPFPGGAVPGSGAGLFDANSSPRFVSWCGLAMRLKAAETGSSELRDSQARETGSSSSSSSPSHAVPLREAMELEGQRPSHMCRLH